MLAFKSQSSWASWIRLSDLWESIFGFESLFWASESLLISQILGLMELILTIVESIYMKTCV